VTAAGTSTIVEKAPLASVRIPPTGIALAVPIVKVAAVVLGGKFSPVNVMVEPVEAETGSIVSFPLGTEIVTLLVFASAFKPPEPTNAEVYMTSALSVTTTYLVPAVVVVGTLTVPTPVPSDPIGKVEVPTKVMLGVMVTVNVAPVLVGETAKPVTDTVRDPPGLIVVGESVIPLAVRVNAVEDSPVRGASDVSTAVKTIVELHALQATACSVGIVVA
jgi:hypothetical protein